MSLMQAKGDPVRRVHEFLFSLNAGLAIASATILGDGVLVPFVSLARRLNYQLGLSGGSATGGYLAFLVCVVLLTASVCLLLRLFRRVSAIEAVLRWTSGLLAIGAAPACWFFMARQPGWYPAESFIYLLCAVLYLRRRWPIPIVPTILFVAVHYGFWGLQFWYYTRHNVAELMVPIVGFCLCLTWGIYVRLPLGDRSCA